MHLYKIHQICLKAASLSPIRALPSTAAATVVAGREPGNPWGPKNSDPPDSKDPPEKGCQNWGSQTPVEIHGLHY